MQYHEGIPENIDELKRNAKRQDDWRTRLNAVEELGNWKCRQSIDILWDRMMRDKVYKVQHAAFIKLQSFDEKVKLPKKKKGNLIKDIDKKLSPVKNALPENHTFDDFKAALRQKKPEIYDTYEGDKENKFEQWLKNKWQSLPKK
ncbi:HEAT repeat domain-containing protein [Chryseomicrobium aureum]|uniref:HEAT repeat domain-containing protein n=1 Tax=Chryseomicrobium aureum TaxID=1441723 RepID=UPI00370D9BFB